MSKIFYFWYLEELMGQGMDWIFKKIFLFFVFRNES